MPDNPQLPPGTPSPINITLADSFGGQKVEQVQVDSNRSIRGERREKWSEAISLPARLPDILLQAFSLVSASAFLTSITRFIPSNPGLMSVAAMLLITFLACVVAAWQKYPELRLFLVYLGCLVVTGGCMGVIL